MSHITIESETILICDCGRMVDSSIVIDGREMCLHCADGYLYTCESCQDEIEEVDAEWHLCQDCFRAAAIDDEKNGLIATIWKKLI